MADKTIRMPLNKLIISFSDLARSAFCFSSIGHPRRAIIPAERQSFLLASRCYRMVGEKSPLRSKWLAGGQSNSIDATYFGRVMVGDQSPAPVLFHPHSGKTVSWGTALPLSCPSIVERPVFTATFP